MKHGDVRLQRGGHQGAENNRGARRARGTDAQHSGRQQEQQEGAAGHGLRESPS